MTKIKLLSAFIQLTDILYIIFIIISSAIFGFVAYFLKIIMKKLPVFFTFIIISEYPANNDSVTGGQIMNQSYFLGSSGRNGFFSLFNQLTPKIDGQYTFLIKGGPGTGKSSFMRKIADEIDTTEIEKLL